MIYLDYNATAPPRPKALAALEAAALNSANPSSLHEAGRSARRILDEAAGAVRRLVGAGAKNEVIFTGSGTEADNLAVLGVARARRRLGRAKVLQSAVEHPAVVAAAERLRQEGHVVESIAVDRDGRIILSSLDERLDPNVALVCVMLANNETGVIEPVAQVAQMAHRHGVPVHVDAVQAAGKIPIDFEKVGADCLAISAHKFGGPRGIGALVVRAGLVLDPLWQGGGQQAGLRSGTPAVPLAAGMAEAAREALDELACLERVRALRDDLETRLRALDGAFVVAGEAERLPNTTAVGFESVASWRLVDELNEAGVATSAGAACHAHEIKPSATLLAMGLDSKRAVEVVRFSLGFGTTAADVDTAVECVGACLSRLRAKT